MAPIHHLIDDDEQTESRWVTYSLNEGLICSIGEPEQQRTFTENSTVCFLIIYHEESSIFKQIIFKDVIAPTL